MTQNKKPTVSTYGDYSSGNYGAHCLEVTIPPSRKGKSGITLYFSYDTIVAFSQNGSKVVHSNDWGTTTGKHLNMIDGGDKSRRLSEEDFSKAYSKAMRQA